MSVEMITVEELKNEEKKFTSITLDREGVTFDCPSDKGLVEYCDNNCTTCWCEGLKEHFEFGTMDGFAKLIGLLRDKKINSLTLGREGIWASISFFHNGKAFYKEYNVNLIKDDITMRMNKYIVDTLETIKY